MQHAEIEGKYNKSFIAIISPARRLQRRQKCAGAVVYEFTPMTSSWGEFVFPASFHSIIFILMSLFMLVSDLIVALLLRCCDVARSARGTHMQSVFVVMCLSVCLFVCVVEWLVIMIPFKPRLLLICHLSNLIHAHAVVVFWQKNTTCRSVDNVIFSAIQQWGRTSSLLRRRHHEKTESNVMRDEGGR